MHIKEVVNPGVFRDTFYRYDLAGRHIRETTVQDEVTYQDNFIAYDALGRMRWIADARAAITIDYDAVGKRTHIHTHVNDLVAEDTDRYYQYDAMNRQTVVDAVDAAGNLGATGHRLTYDKNGNRTSDTHNGLRLVEAGGPGSGLWAAQAGETQEVYGYDALGRLETTDRDGVRVDRRTYDAANRVISSGPEALPAAYMALHRMHMGTTGNDPLQGRRNEYDANGWLRHQDTFEYGVSLTGVNYDYDDVGNVVKTLAVPVEADPEKRAFTTTTYELTRFEGYQVVNSVSATRKTADEYDVPQSLAGLAYAYDVNGHLLSTGDAGQITHPTLRTHNFVNDAAGNALYASYSAEGAGQHEHAQRQLVVNGEVLGRYGEVADQRFEGFPIPQFKGEAQFSFGYQPINGSYPAGSPGTYAVAAGDTLKSIAKGAYGDASLWYLIADANGLSSDADLRTGQVLTIPTRVSSANNASTFKPYDPTKIAHDTPTMMAAPGNQGGCGGIGQVIVAVIAVVVTVYTAGLASGASGAFLATMQAGATTLAGAGAASGTALVATAAGSAAVGSIVSQGVGVAIGAQDSFSWKQVALSAVGGGVTAGLGGFAPTGNVFADAVIRGAVANAATQGVAVATGLQSSFNWRSVAASAVSSGVAKGLNAAMGYNPVNGFEFGKSLVTGIGGSVIGQAVRGGKVSAATLATDAFGNILGDYLAAANGQKSVPAPVGENERQAIMGLFDGSGTGSSAALAYLANNRWSGMSDTSAPASIGSRYDETFGRGTSSVADRLRLGSDDLDTEIAGAKAFLDHMNAQSELNKSPARLAANAAYNGDSAQASRELLGGGPGGIAEVKPLNSDASYGFTNAELASMHTENTNRAQQLAAESAAASGGGASMWVDGSGVPHIVMSGVGSTGSPVNAAETAAPWQPAPVSSLEAFGQGWRGDGWGVLEHGTQPKPFTYGLGGGTRAVVDSLTGAGAINRARQAFANGQNTRGVIYSMQGFGEAGLTAMSLGSYALAKTAVMGAIGARGSVGAIDAVGASAKGSANAGTSKSIGEASVIGDLADASLPLGSKRLQLNQPKSPAYQPVRNGPMTIGGTNYSGHAVDRMQDRGLMPSVVQHTIDAGASSPSRLGTTVHYDPVNNVSVVVNSLGKVVTVKHGK